MIRTRDYSLNGVTVTTFNTEQMITFYNSLFNTRLQPVPLGDFNLYEGRLGNLNITFIPSNIRDVPTMSGHHQLSFKVSGLEAFIRRVERFGGTPLEQIFQDENVKYCSVADPDGNTIELLEKTTDPRMAFYEPL